MLKFWQIFFLLGQSQLTAARNSRRDHGARMQFKRVHFGLDILTTQLTLLRRWWFWSEVKIFLTTGGPNWPSWGSEDYWYPQRAQTDILEEGKIFVTHKEPKLTFLRKWSIHVTDIDCKKKQIICCTSISLFLKQLRTHLKRRHDTAWESDHFLFQTFFVTSGGVPTDLLDTTWESDDFSLQTLSSQTSVPTDLSE